MENLLDFGQLEGNVQVCSSPMKRNILLWICSKDVLSFAVAPDCCLICIRVRATEKRPKVCFSSWQYWSRIVSYYAHYVLPVLKLSTLPAALQCPLYIVLLSPRFRWRAKLCKMLLPSTARFCAVAVEDKLAAIKRTPVRSWNVPWHQDDSDF